MSPSVKDGKGTESEPQPAPTSRPVFLRWALVTTLALVAFVVAFVSYHGHVHAVGKASAGIVLAVFALTSAYCGLLAWRSDDGHPDRRSLEHVSFAIRVCPMLAMLGTASGFLIAFTGSTEDVQQRVAGASTGIVATVVGVACTIVLMVQRHLLDER